MRYHLLKSNLLYAPLCIGLLCLNGDSLAQVYKSYDAEGNVVFSDTPTPGGSEVELNKPNVTDAFEIPPQPPPAPEPENEPARESGPDPTTQPTSESSSADTNNDGRISRREKEEFRKEQRRKRRELKKDAEEDNE